MSTAEVCNTIRSYCRRALMCISQADTLRPRRGHLGKLYVALRGSFGLLVTCLPSVYVTFLCLAFLSICVLFISEKLRKDFCDDHRRLNVPNYSFEPSRRIHR